MMLKPDLQSIYEQMRQHLLTMPGPAWSNEVGACQYRAPDGNSCLIGCLLTDEAAKEADEHGTDAKLLGKRYFPSVPRVETFFDEAQTIHDMEAAESVGKDATRWRENALSDLDELAEDYGLLSYAQKDS